MSKLVEAIRDAVHAALNNAPYPWQHERADACKLSEHVATSVLAAIEREGWKVVPVEPTEEMLKAGHLAMPVEYKYWQEGGMLHAEIRPHHECVSAASPWSAMLSASPKQ